MFIAELFLCLVDKWVGGVICSILGPGGMQFISNVKPINFICIEYRVLFCCCSVISRAEQVRLDSNFSLRNVL
jgi:hypothetical protein